ncbi:hypothetical protein FRB94_008919 [Tulasnella sp. JGI-2019a]|nr:hypothetical protein FRB94_008919 [Tulasnella sp. JGI-2019a]
MSAQVCKPWSPMAIDVKWRTCKIQLSCVLSRLAPFFQVVFRPKTVCSFGKTDITKEQWDQFQNEYAGKVTELDIDVVLSPASRSILENLVQPHGGPLFPRLWKLYVKPYYSQLGGNFWRPMTALVACPTLRSVEIAQGNLHGEEMDDVIFAVFAKAPHINDVSIHIPRHCPAYAAFSEVKQLAISGFFDHESSGACADLPKLESLTLWEAPDVKEYGFLDYKIRWKLTYAVTFATLTTLRIYDSDEGREARFIVSIFRNATIPLLYTIDLYCTRDVDMTLIRRYLARRSPLLREINLNGEEEKGPIEIEGVGEEGDESDDDGSEEEEEVDKDGESDYYQW